MPYICGSDYICDHGLYNSQEGCTTLCKSYSLSHMVVEYGHSVLILSHSVLSAVIQYCMQLMCTIS